MEVLTLRLLGKFEAHGAAVRPIHLPSKRTQGLLARLAIRPGQAHAREQLATLLWPDASDREAHHNLRQTLFLLRKALAPAQPFLGGANGAALSLDPTVVEVDTITFERLVEEGTPEALGRATALYRADLLEGFPSASGTFEEWLLAERERLRELAGDALARLLAHQARAQDAEPAIHTALKLLALDPLQEPVYRTLMCLYLRQGRRAAALRQYQICVWTLRKELGAEPEPETRALYREALLQLGRKVGTATHISVGRRGFVRRPADVEAPLVCRDAEMTALGDALIEAWSGAGRVVFIVGEAGIGKTRLVETLADEACARGGRALVARGWESEQALPFQLWIDLVREGGVLSQRDLVERLGLARRAELARLFPELSESPPSGGSSPQSPARLFEAMGELLDQWAERQPLLLVLDDLHWADEMSLRLLSFLGRRLRGVLVAATARDEEIDAASRVAGVIAGLERDGHAFQLRLAALSRADTASLVQALARAGADVTWLAEAGERIWALSEGNPFVIVECMRSEGWGMGAGPPALPARVRDVIAARLERLSAAAGQLATVAAVIGREFDFPVAQRAANLDAEPAAEGAEELVRRRVFDAAGERFRFTHDRIRHVAYEGLLAPRRRLLHERVAEALEAVHASHLHELADQLAHHYTQASMAERAVRWLDELVKTALRRYAFEEAERWLNQASSLLDQVPAAERDRLHLPLVVRRKAYLLSLRGCSREVLDLLAPLRERVEAVGDPSLAGWYFFRLAYAYNYLGHPGETRAAAERALAEGTRARDSELEACAHVALAMQSYSVGEPLAGTTHAREALARLGTPPPVVWLGYAYSHLAGNLYLLGDFPSALAAAETAMALGVHLAETVVQVEAGLMAGRIHLACGAWERIPEACRVALESPSVLSRVAGSALLGYARLDQGDPAAAVPVLHDAVDEMARRGLCYMAGRFMPILAEALLATGDLEGARSTAHRALRFNNEIRARWVVGLCHRALGRIAWAERDMGGAERAVREALATFAAVPMPYELARTHGLLGELAHVQGRRCEAVASLTAGWGLLRRLDIPKRLAEYEETARSLGYAFDREEPLPYGRARAS
jgi:DNA-binding SARP family transcriptional activator/tetratricopeptide (TPR) repeat protein